MLRSAVQVGWNGLHGRLPDRYCRELAEEFTVRLSMGWSDRDNLAPYYIIDAVP